MIEYDILAALVEADDFSSINFFYIVQLLSETYLK